MQVRFAVIKDKAIPSDAESYKMLCSLGLRSTVYDVDFMETLKLIAKKKRITLIGVPFVNILNEFSDKISSAWCKNPKRKFSQKKNCFIFEVRSLKDNPELMVKLEDYLREFFVRWGFSLEIDYKKTSSKLVMKANFTFNKMPIIPTKD